MVFSLSNLIQKIRNVSNIIDLQGRNSQTYTTTTTTYPYCILIIENQEEQRKYREHFD